MALIFLMSSVYISLLFSSMLVHGTAPAGLLLSTLVPLLKKINEEINAIRIIIEL